MQAAKKARFMKYNRHGNYSILYLGQTRHDDVKVVHKTCTTFAELITFPSTTPSYFTAVVSASNCWRYVGGSSA